MFEEMNMVCAGKSKLELAAEKEYFTDAKMKVLGSTVNGVRGTADRIDSIVDKLEGIADQFSTAGVLLDRAVERGDSETVDTLEAQIEAISDALPDSILALEKVLGLNKKAKKISKEDAAKMLGL